jgi:hypothetical protein
MPEVAHALRVQGYFYAPMTVADASSNCRTVNWRWPELAHA